MRIVQVTPGYYPYMGGVERVVKNMAEYLAKDNNQVTVYTTDPSNKLPKLQMINGVTVKNYFALAPNEAYYFPDPKMLLHLLKEQTDVIHAHSIHALTILVAYAAHDLRPKPKFIVSPYYHRQGHTRLAQTLWMPFRPVMRRVLGAADAIVVNSNVLKRTLEKTFKPSCKIFVIYDGVNLKEIEDAKPFVLEKNLKALLYVGRLEKYKNVHLAISSMKFLPENYHFFVIGNGPYKFHLKDLAQSMGVQERVHFLGFQPDAIVNRWLKTAHLFVHLSTVESFGMTCIESLAAGTPVIANDDNFGLSETMGMYPKHIFAFKSSKEPVSKLAELIMQVAEMKPISVDVSKFSWDNIGKSLCSVYEEVLVDG